MRVASGSDGGRIELRADQNRESHVILGHSAALYLSTIEHLRARGVSEADVERHNLGLAALTQLELDKVLAIARRIGDRDLADHMERPVRGHKESSVMEPAERN